MREQISKLGGGAGAFRYHSGTSDQGTGASPFWTVGMICHLRRASDRSTFEPMFAGSSSVISWWRQVTCAGRQMRF